MPNSRRFAVVWPAVRIFVGGEEFRAAVLPTHAYDHFREPVLGHIGPLPFLGAARPPYTDILVDKSLHGVGDRVLEMRSLLQPAFLLVRGRGHLKGFPDQEEAFFLTHA